MTERQPQGLTPIELAEEIGELQFVTARSLAASEPFDWRAAEIALRGPAVFTDRLRPTEFAILSDSVQNGFRHLSEIAVNKLGVTVDPQREGESDYGFIYRTQVHGVMHGLQSMVNTGPFPDEGGYDPDKENIVREGVFLASQLFSLALPEAVEKGFPDVLQTLRYFNEKAQQTARYAGRNT